LSDRPVGHKYTVEFRIYGKNLQPDLITQELGLQPCQIRPSGESSSQADANLGMWAFDGSDKGGVEWDSLEDGISAVLDKLWAKREIIQQYRPEKSLIWWCGNFQSAFDGGPTLHHALLVRLVEMGADIFIDNYFCDR
jgi:uncharacterized protein DUF4279